MPSIYVYVDKNNFNENIFHGKSSSEITFAIQIIKVDVKSKDNLISYALANTPENCYILCAYDSLVTSCSSEYIYNTLEFAISKIEFDVFYLTLYADNCLLCNDEYSYENLTIRRSISPHGTECILISPNGVNKILNEFEFCDGRGIDFYLNNRGETMMLYSSYPPLIFIDISKRDSDLQLIKSSICRENINRIKPKCKDKKKGNMNLFWFFLILFTIVLISILTVNFRHSCINGRAKENNIDIEIHKKNENLLENKNSELLEPSGNKTPKSIESFEKTEPFKIPKLSENSILSAA